MLVSGQSCQIDHVNHKGETALHSICRNSSEYSTPWSTRKITTVKRLIHFGASPLHLDKDGKSPLHYACKNEDVEMVKILLDNWITPGVLSLHEEYLTSASENYSKSIIALSGKHVETLHAVSQSQPRFWGNDIIIPSPLFCLLFVFLNKYQKRIR